MKYFTPSTLGIGIILLMVGMTFQRNRVWGSEVQLWQDTVSKSPTKMRPRMNLAYAYQNAKDYPNAIHEYQNALLLATDQPGPEARFYRQLAAMNVGNIFMEDDQPDAALDVMIPVWNDDPGFPGLALNIGTIFFRKHQPQLAIGAFNEGIKHMREYPSITGSWMLYLNNALVYRSLQQCDKFESYFQAAKRLAYPEPIEYPACP